MARFKLMKPCGHTVTVSRFSRKLTEIQRLNIFAEPCEQCGAAVPLPRIIRQVCDHCLITLFALGDRLFCRRCGAVYKSNHDQEQDQD